jgi:transmembrane sensor
MKAILAEAVDWYVRLQDSSATEQTHAQWQVWLDADPRHVQGWERVVHLQQRLQQLPAGLSSFSLQRARAQRRSAVKALAVLLGSGMLGWQGYQRSPWSADYRTGVGQRSHLMLADGTRLELNTDSRVDVRFDDKQRRIFLHRGEILVQTAADPRPLSVYTAEGRIFALGTRFTVRQMDELTRVSVEAHAVQIHPRQASVQEMLVQAGQALDFSATGIGPLQLAAPSGSAWIQGMLVVVDWRLAEVLAELSRYRPGYLGCSREVASLRLSGSFDLSNIEAILASLQDALPIRARRLSRYWVRFESVEA